MPGDVTRTRAVGAAGGKKHATVNLMKVPVTGQGGSASSTDPETWMPSETALEYTDGARRMVSGLYLTDDDPIVGAPGRLPRSRNGDADDAAQD